jgi:hypothetical protein
MEGLLEKYDTKKGGIFASGVWDKYFFILHQEILIFTDANERTKILGRLHMQVSKILPEDQTFVDGEIRIHSGLMVIRLRAATIKEKINWKNALLAAQKKANERQSEQRRTFDWRDERGSMAFKSNQKL